MACASCDATNLRKFMGEVAILLPGPNAVEPTVFVWPEFVICLSCGLAQFSVPKAELRILAKGSPTSGLWQD